MVELESYARKCNGDVQQGGKGSYERVVLKKTVLVWGVDEQAPQAKGKREGLLLLGLLGEEDRVDVGDDTTVGDGHLGQKLVELLIVADGELDVTRDDAHTLVVAGGVTGELEDLRGEVLEDGGEVDGGTGTDAGGVASTAELGVDTTDGELESGAERAGGGRGLLRLAGSGRHLDVCMFCKRGYE